MADRLSPQQFYAATGVEEGRVIDDGTRIFFPTARAHGARRRGPAATVVAQCSLPCGCGSDTPAPGTGSGGPAAHGVRSVTGRGF